MTGDWLELDLIMPANGTIAMWAKPIDFYNYHSIFDNSGNGDDWVRALFAVGLVGAVLVPVNTFAGPEELREQIGRDVAEARGFLAG